MIHCSLLVVINAYKKPQYLYNEIDLQFKIFQVEVDYTEETFSISNYPLSAALTCAKICSSFEEVWGVV